VIGSIAHEGAAIDLHFDRRHVVRRQYAGKPTAIQRCALDVSPKRILKAGQPFQNRFGEEGSGSVENPMQVHQKANYKTHAGDRNLA
jgi:hypothetical protein